MSTSDHGQDLAVIRFYMFCVLQLHTKSCAGRAFWCCGECGARVLARRACHNPKDRRSTWHESTTLRDVWCGGDECANGSCTDRFENGTKSEGESPAHLPHPSPRAETFAPRDKRTEYTSTRNAKHDAKKGQTRLNFKYVPSAAPTIRCKPNRTECAQSRSNQQETGEDECRLLKSTSKLIRTSQPLSLAKIFCSAQRCIGHFRRVSLSLSSKEKRTSSKLLAKLPSATPRKMQE